ncbi:dehydrogenase [Nitzschia inconspicua]|uniref:Dehydrogenase n=1 Tax=Nitzschia inconspicua TaxID=303405 RepID=A0A9K3L853_9STRA|nr:dehydrogenase [Nitzschia inconspicua]
MKNQQKRTKVGDRTIVSIPPERALVIDGGILGSKRHIIYGLVEVDVTRAREIRRNQENKVSFTAYLVACLARAVEKHPDVQAYKIGRKNIIFDNVDVSTMIEAGKGGVAIPHILRNANLRSVRDISDEIQKIKSCPEQSEQNSGNLAKKALKVPRWVRMIFYQCMKRDPDMIRDKMGTVMLTSVGMFGNGNGFGITYMPLHTLGLTVGGIQTKPGYIHGEVVPREYLSITMAFDHDIVDGAPAARFAKDLVAFIQDGRLMLDEKREEKADS